jgi:hypothetical protein
VVNAPQSSSDVNSPVVVQLALHTLAHFSFKVISFPKLTVHGLVLLFAAVLQYTSYRIF